MTTLSKDAADLYELAQRRPDLRAFIMAGDADGLVRAAPDALKLRNSSTGRGSIVVDVGVVLAVRGLARGDPAYDPLRRAIAGTGTDKLGYGPFDTEHPKVAPTNPYGQAYTPPAASAPVVATTTTPAVMPAPRPPPVAAKSFWESLWDALRGA